MRVYRALCACFVVLACASIGHSASYVWDGNGRGAAASVVDFHSFLARLSPCFVRSFARDIDESGVIVGSAVSLVGSSYVSYAVKWSPIPEPTSFALAYRGLVGLTLWRTGRWASVIFPALEPHYGGRTPQPELIAGKPLRASSLLIGRQLS
jgi:hypothetical protein